MSREAWMSKMVKNLDDVALELALTDGLKKKESIYREILLIITT